MAGLRSARATSAGGVVHRRTGDRTDVLLVHRRTPRLWALPLNEYLGASGMPVGWAWLAQLGKGDILALAGIALLAGVSIPCLMALSMAYAGRGERAYCAIALLLAGVLVLAASGVLTAH